MLSIPSFVDVHSSFPPASVLVCREPVMVFDAYRVPTAVLPGVLENLAMHSVLVTRQIFASVKSVSTGTLFCSPAEVSHLPF